MAMDFSWLPPGQDANRLPLGMRVNNPGNIKYNPKLGYSGMLGPSSHTDQGDAQMTFDTPQSGMTAAARMTAFLKALTRQEHGESSGLYGDDVYAAASGRGGGNMPAGSSYLTKALNMAGMIPGQVPAGGPAPKGGGPLARGPQPLPPPQI